MTSKQQLKEQNRVLVILVIAVMIMSWVMINSGEYLTSAILYIGLGLTSLVLITIWEKLG